MLMPVSADYVDAVVAKQTEKSRAMMRLVPHSFKIGALEDLAYRCTSILSKNIEMLESLRNGLRAGLDAGTVMYRASLCTTHIAAIEEYGLPPLHYQTREMAVINDVLRGLHREMALPFPCPTACCISEQQYASHSPTHTIYSPMGEAMSILHFAHFYHELGHYLIRPSADLQLEPLHKGLERASQTIEAHHEGLMRDGIHEGACLDTVDYVGWLRSRRPAWLEEFFCDLFGALGGGPASAWAYLHTVAEKFLPIYALDASTPQTHPPNDARMEVMCAGLRLMGFDRDADEVWARWRDVADAVGGSPSLMYRHAVPKGPLLDMARIIHESFGETGIVLYDPSSRKRSGSRMRVLLNDAWDVFWHLRPGEFKGWEAAELKNLGGSV